MRTKLRVSVIVICTAELYSLFSNWETMILIWNIIFVPSLCFGSVGFSICDSVGASNSGEALALRITRDGADYKMYCRIIRATPPMLQYSP